MLKFENNIIETKNYAAEIWGPLQTNNNFLNITLKKMIFILCRYNQGLS